MPPYNPCGTLPLNQEDYAMPTIQIQAQPARLPQAPRKNGKTVRTFNLRPETIAKLAALRAASNVPMSNIIDYLVSLAEVAPE